MKNIEEIERAVSIVTSFCHIAACESGWWKYTDGKIQDFNVPEKLMLVVSEVAEAMEGFRKDLMDDKLPHRKMIEVELADALIRICDLAGAMQLDLGGAVAEKLLYNASRDDHKPENRAKEGGKKF
jgi:NTP pyrophosphatase (non-canonical NTP hydrolase)